MSNRTMRQLALAALMLLPLAANADDGEHCKVSEPRSLQLDLRGIDTVVFDVGGSDVDVRAAATASGKVEGRACASNDTALKQLTLTQQTVGKKLIVTAERKSPGGKWFGNEHARLELQASVPDSVMVQLKVGSGDASIDGARTASVDVGSGDVHATRIRGPFTAAIGSGDLTVDDIGALNLLSIGSGDASFKRVRGTATIGSVGSGDLEIRGTTGAVTIGTVGAGDVTLADIGGGVSVDSVGSGDVEVDGVKGDFAVGRGGSGDVNHQGVTGRVEIPRAR